MENEKKKKNRKPSFYYAWGSTISILSLIVMIVFLFLPSALKDGLEYINYISLGAVILSLVCFIFGYFLLKKANYLKTQKTSEETKMKMEDEYYKSLREDQLAKIDSQKFEEMLNKKNKKD